jgi:oligoribonuclease
MERIGMKYISIDIETTGLNPKTCDILEIGAFIEDTSNPRPRSKLPTFHAYIWKENYRGEPFALAMNAHIFKKILDLRQIETPEYLVENNPQFLLDPEEVYDAFSGWLYQESFGNKYSRYVVAGKNVSGFDLPFLSECIPSWEIIKFHHRVIDPGMLYFDPLTDTVPPDLKECKKRAGLPELVTHAALDDAWDVIQLIRAKFPVLETVKIPEVEKIKMEKDGYCSCNCSTKCPLGKTGSAMRCTRIELMAAGIPVCE